MPEELSLVGCEDERGLLNKQKVDLADCAEKNLKNLALAFRREIATFIESNSMVKYFGLTLNSEMNYFE